MWIKQRSYPRILATSRIRSRKCWQKKRKFTRMSRCTTLLGIMMDEETGVQLKRRTPKIVSTPRNQCSIWPYLAIRKRGGKWMRFTRKQQQKKEGPKCSINSPPNPMSLLTCEWRNWHQNTRTTPARTPSIIVLPWSSAIIMSVIPHFTLSYFVTLISPWKIH